MDSPDVSEPRTTLSSTVTQIVTLRELPGLSDELWEQAIAAYPDRTVFHGAAWHRGLNDALPGRVVRFEIEVGGEVCGHWCGYLIKKLGMGVFGAPLPGTATDYMFPLFSKPPAPSDFLQGVRRWASERRVGLVEVGGEFFDDDVFRASGYEIKPTRTYRVDLSGGDDVVWQRLKPAMRNKVRKAEKAGVTVVEDHSPTFAKDFSTMLKSVFNRQGMAPSYDERRISTVVKALSSAGHVTTLTAAHENVPLASVILLHDHRTAYFWAGASYPAAYPVGANDIIQWRALQLAMSRGLTCYDACGGGEYKEKFGGTFVSLPAGHLVMNPMFGLVRSSVMKGFRAKQALVGAVQRVAAGWR